LASRAASFWLSSRSIAMRAFKQSESPRAGRILVALQNHAVEFDPVLHEVGHGQG